MRHFELSTPIAATPEQVWAALLDLEAWPRWNRLVPEGRATTARGVAVGERLSFQIRVSPRDAERRVLRPHRPVVRVVNPPRELVLEATVLGRWFLSMVHHFHVVPTQDGCELRQSWDTSGLLATLIWPRLQRAQADFSELGEDLGRYLARSVSP